MKLLLLLLLFSSLVSSGCRSSRSGDAALGTATPEAAWIALVQRGASFEGGRILASIRLPLEGKPRTFRARIDVDGDGDLSLTALSPIGTELFGINIVGSEAVILDHRRKEYWRGSASTLPSMTSPLFALDLRALSRLLFGLPPRSSIECSPAAQSVSCLAGTLTYQVTPEGIAAVSSSTGDRLLLSGGYPPQEIRFASSSGESAGIEILEIVNEPTQVDPPELGSDWKCCLSPALPVTEIDR